ncbi:Predicted DNA-binding protein, UPF0251 family [Sporobacter termitidis DSM 10068]|uniref:UPF0251 protein SAMN02745823_03551 n=1 Tax=Sporobacter termitidis DSM 10068 TaxID=1123282 RepID=A0A1M5ZD19_9FIRM|nr:DUF134 domain-containing protein [Sporobacter termitidis]SHI22108.1 Predicted DNA-binding protein, UPF0251 family [Sporobacter termitidis DSM 10068]
MPRGFKCRRICTEPDNTIFTPGKPCGGAVNLVLEELEAVRLCDLEGLEQDEAAERMNISRGTLQRILYDARRKIAEALCAGKTIVIGGGNYEVSGRPCGCPYHCKSCRFEDSDRHHEKGESIV